MTFRSLAMQHYMLVISQDSAYDTMNRLAKLESVHLKDTSDPANRPFTQSIRRCE